MAVGEYRPEPLTAEDYVLPMSATLEWAWPNPVRLAKRYRAFYEELYAFMSSDDALALTRDLLKCEQKRVLPLLNEVAE